MAGEDQRPFRYAGRRQVTGFLSEETYRRTIAVKTHTGKTILEQIEEGLILVAAQHLPDDENP